jgi:hypothetical protein
MVAFIRGAAAEARVGKGRCRVSHAFGVSVIVVHLVAALSDDEGRLGFLN